MLVSFFIWIVRLYQKTLSPDHGWVSFFYPYGYCRFYPTCSEYMCDALRKRGVVVGGWMGMKRVLRCHPWSAGGVDRV